MVEDCEAPYESLVIVCPLGNKYSPLLRLYTLLKLILERIARPPTHIHISDDDICLAYASI